MKSIKAIKRGGGRKADKRVMEGMNLSKVHHKYVWKYHNETPLYN
jgi:hypothetical protein